MIHAGTEVDAQAAVGDFNTIGRHIQRGVAAHHKEDVEIFQNRLTFNGHVEDARTDRLPIQLRHFQRDVISAVVDGQLVAERTPAPTLVERIFIRVHNGDRQAGKIAAHGKGQIGLVHAGFGLIGHTARANRKHNGVIRVGVGQRFCIADTEIIEVDAAAGEFHAQRSRAGIERYRS